jgi:hypothetical protein
MEKKRGIEYKEGINEQRGKEGTGLKRKKGVSLRREERKKNGKGLLGGGGGGYGGGA